ncbi:MAG: ABC transporter ATP-binding protein [Deltaproteobacteria bacterium]|nr:ABC transporter ATP-binding protein [Deltaproteobacteria bacterium]MBW1748765.1 ABC transporter ATP-binding protein [Deltaproteobacteria bacterium]MBW2198233.1 ABC transporter ATP-binding protein [Deltaproteobacteria bacterium]MBW2326935.1 ABC transporter ATP-binding protein [Deltaproteobacteria bacterium]
MGDEKKPLPHRFLTVRDLCKSFENSETRIDILKGVNLDMDAGQTLAIVGASGIGKSTLLHILGALDRPDSGAYFFDGDDIFVFDQIRLAQFRNDTVGFVFQFHYLLPEFSALENTMMPVLIKGMRKKEAREIAEAMLVRVNLKDRLNFRAGKLSGGEQQRVALARALVLKPAMLLADEPTGNLDKRNSEFIHDLLLELNDEFGMTLIVVTHNMELASYMSRTTTIVDGRLLEL